MNTLVKALGFAAILVFVASLIPACGGDSSATVRVSFLMGNDGNKSNAAPMRDAALGKGHADAPGAVDVDDIAHLFVDVARIVLTHAPGNPNAHHDHVVEVGNRTFDPVTIEIVQGDSVTWEWIEDGLHTVTSESNGAPNAGNLFDESMENTGDEIVVTFPDTGIFPYFSTTPEDIDAGMVGTVLVSRDNGGKSMYRETTRTAKSNRFAHRPVVVPINLTVDLKELTVVANVLSAEETIPAGKYTAVTLHVENPDLRLASDPEVPITNVRLTANGRLAVKKPFNLPANDDVLIGFEFGGIHLVQTSDGLYVLMPQLHADIDVRRALAKVRGTITSLDCNTEIVTIDVRGTIYEAMIVLDTVILDENDMAIDCSDLNGGQTVELTGALDASLTIVADEIEIVDEFV